MTPLRIGFAGNQNNSPFMLARALRAAGHDVRFLIDRPEPLNRPEFRYADIRYPYPSWIEEIPTFEVDDVVYRTAAWRTLLDRLSDCDVVVLNSMAFAAAADLAMPAICQVTGSDLEFYCDRTRGERYALFQDYKGRTRHWRNAVMTMPPPSVEALRHIANGLPSPLFHYYRAHMFRRAADRHMAGLRASRAVICLPTGAVPLSDRLLDAALTPATARVLSFMVESDRFQPVPLPAGGPLRIFNPARLNWSEPAPQWVNPWENKRTDLLLEGVSLYTQRANAPIEVHLVEKGHAVESTRAIVARLGLDGIVHWHREMPQSELTAHYEQAHVITDQFGDHLVGLAGYEAMAMGRPLLCNWRPDVFTPAFGEAAPVAQARTPAEIAQQLEHLSRADYRAQLAVQGRAWVGRHLSPQVFMNRLEPVLSHIQPRRMAA